MQPQVYEFYIRKIYPKRVSGNLTWITRYFIHRRFAPSHAYNFRQNTFSKSSRTVFKIALYSTADCINDRPFWPSILWKFCNNCLTDANMDFTIPKKLIGPWYSSEFRYCKWFIYEMIQLTLKCTGWDNPWRIIQDGWYKRFFLPFGFTLIQINWFGMAFWSSKVTSANEKLATGVSRYMLMANRLLVTNQEVTFSVMK